MAPLDALPPELQDVENHFPDDGQYGTNWFGKLYRWYQKKTKTWFSFSYRCKEGWAKWRKYPKVLFAVGGDGPWRLETDVDSHLVPDSFLFFPESSFCWLSRVQYYKRWHIAIQWPLLISFHFYFKPQDVPKYAEQVFLTDGRLFFFYWSHFDNDLIFWMFTSIYAGFNWK